MSISLLLTERSEQTKIEARAFGQMALEASFSRICQDKGELEYLLACLASPVIDQETIAYRRGVLKDFMRCKGLLVQLLDFFERFRQCREEWKRHGRAHQSSVHSTDLRSSRDMAITLCRVNAQTLKSTCLFLSELHRILSSFPISSDALRGLRDRVQAMLGRASYRELISICTRLESISIAAPINLKISLHPRGYIEAAELIDAPRLFSARVSKKARSRRAPDATSHTRLPLAPSGNAFYAELAAAPFYDISREVNQLSEQLFDEYIGIGTELTFYKAALDYTLFLSQKGIPFVFPECVTQENTRFTDLYELGLIVSEEKHSDAVPYTLHAINKPGVIVFGRNSSGKTVFLRAVAALHVLAQSGLPVPARAARVKLYRHFFALFVDGEHPAEDGGLNGRFENEVLLMKNMIEDLRRDSLVFLNEPFQTTSYDEGAKGLSDILQFLSRNQVDWILVSHITQLKYYLTSDRVTFLETEEGYKLKMI